MSKDDWIDAGVLRDLLGASGRRTQCDVKVSLWGNLVPVIGLRYHRAADVYVLDLDEDCEDYRIAMAKHLPESEQ